MQRRASRMPPFSHLPGFSTTSVRRLLSAAAPIGQNALPRGRTQPVHRYFAGFTFSFFGFFFSLLLF
jgi:hypothetical protein